MRAIPDIDWVTIPAGEFIYQNGTMSLDYDFQISRYPVTYAQFQAFIDDSEGFYDPRWWEGLAIPDGHNDAPGDQRFKFWNHPRERVSWLEAIAFCRWWSFKLGGGYDLDAIGDWRVRLPTEFEWEKAARGTDGREYPWGDGYRVGHANINEVAPGVGPYNLGRTTAVGLYPQGASPYGVLDLSGNVFEWCLSAYGPPKQRAADEDMRSNARRVLRGGSWGSSHVAARAAFRYFNVPSYRNVSYGFRLVCVRAPSL